MKVKMLFFICLTLLLTSFAAGQTEYNLTADEVVDIALSDPEVSEWVAINEYEVGTPYIAYDDVWLVIFFAKSSELHVYIDDATSEVVDIDHIKYDVYEESYPEAITFVRNHEFLSGLGDNLTQFSWSAYSYNSVIYVYGSRSSNDYQWINAELEIDDSSEFTLLKMNANFGFGSPSLNLEEVTEIMYSLEDVQEYLALVEDVYLSFSISYELNRPNLYQYDFYFNPNIYYAYDTVTESPNEGETSEGSEGADDSGDIDESYRYGFAPCGEYHWMNIVISGEGEILGIFGSTTADLTEDEVMDLMVADATVGPWLETIPDVIIDLYFDGYGIWWISVYSYTTADFGYMGLNETSSEVIDLYIFEPIPAELSESEVKEIAISHLDIENWIESVRDYHEYFYYDNQGTWYVYLYDPIVYQNYVWMVIDDAKGSVEEVRINLIETNLELSEIYEILIDEGVGDFLEEYPDAMIYLYYSDYSYYDREYGEPSESNAVWNVYIYSPVIIEAGMSLTIDDETGQVLQKTTRKPAVAPSQSVDSIGEMIENLDIYSEFVSQVEVEYSSVYYYDGAWYGWYSGVAANGTYLYLSVSVSDVDISEYDAVIGGYGCGWFMAEADDLARDTSEGQNSNPEGMLLADFLEESPRSTNPVGLPSFGLLLTLLSFAAITLIVRRSVNN
ncbi:MAG: hypothetical protein ACXAE3_05785 [Candidatus Kariarchaeaceae archaeon]